ELKPKSRLKFQLKIKSQSKFSVIPDLPVPMTIGDPGSRVHKCRDVERITRLYVNYDVTLYFIQDIARNVPTLYVQTGHASSLPSFLNLILFQPSHLPTFKPFPLSSEFLSHLT